MKIRTRKIQATETKGEFVTAAAMGSQLRVPWDYGMNAEDMHAYAARRMAQKLCGSYAAPAVQVVETNERGYVFEVAI